MKEFNIVIAGLGGQGSITLAQIVAEAALKENYDVKTSELHGLAQRYGSVPCHVRFGEKIYSSLVLEGEANLIIGLEPLEALRVSYYGSKENKTTFLINSKKIIPISVPVLGESYPDLKEIVNLLKNFSANVIVLNASDMVERETGDVTMANVYMLGYAYSTKLLLLKKEFLFQGIEEIVPEKYVELNKKIFELGEKSGAKIHR